MLTSFVKSFKLVLLLLGLSWKELRIFAQPALGISRYIIIYEKALQRILKYNLVMAPKTKKAPPTTETPTPTPTTLTGSDLIEKVKELGNLSKEEKAKICGYYTVTKNGIERVNMMKFLNALIEAEGIDLDNTSNADRRGGRSASYRITVQTNGNLLIGKAYTKQLGVNPGDEFEVVLGRKHIRLQQVNAESDSDS